MLCLGSRAAKQLVEINQFKRKCMFTYCDSDYCFSLSHSSIASVCCAAVRFVIVALLFY